ncbi:hypothetical protein DPMN_183775 [Dreissena polymorpha]|uniref:Uncharacterized protein n=1 Tax=Dreissena polymorpha TaxID=45954 RepID=A0A9D4DIR4_DREPO|nr:hypothetical protein DPMN_183775 [Dreissena polymorpha]
MALGWVMWTWMVEIDCVVMRDFQGSSASSVGGDRTDQFYATQDIIRTNALTKFHKDQFPAPWRPFLYTDQDQFKHIQDKHVLTKAYEEEGQYVCRLKKYVPPPDGHVFKSNKTIFERVQDIIETNLLTKQNTPPPGGHVLKSTGNILTSKNALPLAAMF